jgi:sec-independent protein translocase protein TatB
VFGFSFSELVVVVVVAIVVIGPKDLPKMLRKLGKYAGQLRRMASDLRAQSGIDDALRAEGLTEDIAEIRKLARGELDSVQKAARVDDSPAERAGSTKSTSTAYDGDFYVVREREYPRDGADSFGALPDNAIVYAEGLPRSKLGNDPLYRTGDPNGEIPPDPKPAFEEEHRDEHHDGEHPQDEAH